MPTGSMKCSKCGYTQMANPTCKSCGAGVNGVLATKLPAQDQKPPAQDVPQVLAKSAGEVAQPKFQPAVADAGQIRQLFFHGTGGSLFGIHIVNTFLTIMTLGIYYFWGKVRVRNYLLSQSEFEGDRFAYHGTGKELLIGFLKAAVVFGAFSTLLNALPYLPGGVTIKIAVFVLAYSILLAFIPIAIVGSRRYRLSRMSWRGIRFSFRGRVVDFIKLFVKGTLLTFFTLGFYYPIFVTQRYAFLLSHSYFGNQKFEFHGRGRDLLGSYLSAILLLLPTLGLYWFWFLAQKQRYLWDHTIFGTARFRSTVTGGRLLLLSLGNLFLLVVTLGLSWSWVTVRNVRFAFAYLTLEGPLDLAVIQQEAQTASPTGEGLDSLLNLDTGLNVA